MDIIRMKQLAGVPVTESDTTLAQLDEVVQLSDDMQIDDLIRRLDACSRAMALVNKMKDPAEKKKWLGKVFVNLNKIRAAIQRQLSGIVDPEGQEEYIDRVRQHQDI